jgi:hypothetical protein
MAATNLSWKGKNGIADSSDETDIDGITLI